MTAEAAVMNRLGVALAADSAVTISLGAGEQKIYTSSDKLFHISEGAPVGLLVYGNAHFLEVPWETVTKEFRRDLTGVVFDHINEYADRFFTFLAEHKDLFPRKIEDQSVARLIAALFLSVREQIRRELDREVDSRNGLDESAIPEIVRAVIRRQLEAVRTRDRLSDFSEKSVSKVRNRNRSIASEIRKHIFATLPLGRTGVRDLNTMAAEMLTRHFFGSAQSGVVVAGFGEKDYMPALLHYRVEEKVLGRPRMVLEGENRISPSNNASVYAFAQQETVHTFMEGIDPDLADFMSTSVTNLFEGIGDHIVNAVNEIDEGIASKLDPVLKAALSPLVKDLLKTWESRRAHQWVPVIEIVSALPKDELADMAEALVNLTKFRRRVTPASETVGGPIDVAIISKGDGFVWIKRKHYFPGELNPRTMARYQRTREG